MEENEIVVVCSGYVNNLGKEIKCGKIKLDEASWKNEDEIKEKYPSIYSNYLNSKKNGKISHTYCPDCFKEVMKILDMEFSEKKRNKLERAAENTNPTNDIEMPPIFYV